MNAIFGYAAAFALGAAAKWLHGALKLQPKTAAKIDAVLGIPGEAQAILDKAEQVIDTTAATVVAKKLS